MKRKRLSAAILSCVLLSGVLMGLTAAPSLAAGPDKIYFVDRADYTVVRASITDGSGQETVYTTATGSPKSVAVDAASGLLYISDVQATTNYIYKSNLDGTNRTALLSSVYANDIAIDAVHGKIYFTEGQTVGGDATTHYRVCWANLSDGSGMAGIYASPLGTPSSIAVDPAGGHIYFSEPDVTVGKIYRANLDGSGVTTLITGVYAKDIAIDTVHGKIYFTESQDVGEDKTTHYRVCWANLSDGSGMAQIYYSNTGSPEGIAVDPAGYVYFSDPLDAAVFRTSLSGSGTTAIVSGVNPVDLAIPLSSDTTPPALTAGTVSRTSDAAATVTFTSGEAGLYYYQVVADGASAPTVDTTGAGTACILGPNSISLLSLTAGAKDIYIKAKDAAGNVSTALKMDIPAYVPPNTSPSFPGGAASLTVAEYTHSNDVKALLHASDTDAGQTLTWTQHTAPAHGTLSISGATASSGGTDITPGGTITYTPAAGYTGSDSFTVAVSDGTASATCAVSVTVKAADKSYTVPAGDFVEMDVNDYSGIADVTSPNASYYYVDFSQPSDGTHTGELYHFYGETWYLRTYANGWSTGLALTTNDDKIRFTALEMGIYTFQVQVNDTDIGKRELRTIKVTVTDGTPPTVLSGAITASDITQTGATLSWSKATDDLDAQSALQYLVYRSGSGNLTSVENTELYGTPVGSYASDIAGKAVFGLSAGTSYYFNVIVKDQAGNTSCYTQKQVVTLAATGTATYNTNLVFNGDAEADNSVMVGWTATGSVFMVLTPESGYIPDPLSSNGGNVFDYYPTAAQSESIYQEIDVSNLSADVDAGVVNVSVSAYARRRHSVTVNMVKLELLSSTNSVLGTYSASGTKPDLDMSWETLTIQQDALASGTRRLRVTLYAQIGETEPLGDFVEFDGVGLILSKEAVPPLLTQGTVSRTSDAAATVTFTSNEAGGYYYTVAAASDPAPMLDVGGAGTACTTSATTISLTTLTAGDKKIYIAVRDAAGNLSNTLSMYIPAYVVPDTDKPVLTAGTVSRTSDTAATVTFTSNEARTYYYSVVASGDPAPTVDATGAGTACTTDETTVSLTTLTAGAKDIYIKVKDAAENVSDALKMTVPAYVPPDTDKPILTAGTVSRTSDTAATVTFTSNEAGTYYYSVVASGDPAPTVDATGAGTACTTDETTISLTTLTAGAKDIYIKVKDAAENVSDALKMTVPAYVPPDTDKPLLTQGTVNRTNNAVATVTFTSNEAGTYYYSVVAAGGLEPTVDTTGAGTACTTEETTISLTTLTAGAKDIYIKVKDAAENVSDALKMVIPAYVAPVHADKDYTIPAGANLDMDVNDYTGITNINYPSSIYYAYVSQPSDGTHTGNLYTYSGDAWHLVTYAGGGIVSPPLPLKTNDDQLRFMASEVGVYTFYVDVIDGGGTPLLPQPRIIRVTVTDATAPTVSNGAITASDITSTGVTLSWNKAADDLDAQSALQYLVYRSGSGNLTTVADTEINGTPVGSYAADLSTKAVSGLSAGTVSYFNVIVKDQAGNKSCYTQKQVVTPIVPAAASYGVNLVFNGDAEADDAVMVGWTATGSSFQVLTPALLVPPVSPNGGNAFDFSASLGISESLYQEIDISALSTDVGAGIVHVAASAYSRKNISGITSMLKLELLGSGGGVLATYTASTNSSPAWETLAINQDAIAAGTRKLRVSLYSMDHASIFPGMNWGQFDGVSLILSRDSVAPVLTAGTVSRTSDTAANVAFTSNEAGTYYYSVVTAGDPAPTVDTSGAGTACTTAETTVSLTTLTAGAKDIYIKVKDAAGNVSGALKMTIPEYTLPVTGITDVPLTAWVGDGLTLAGTVSPENAAYRTIVWSVQADGGTGSGISGDTLTAATPGTVTVLATIEKGLSASQAYTQSFDIEVRPAMSLQTIQTLSGTATITAEGLLDQQAQLIVTPIPAQDADLMEMEGLLPGKDVFAAYEITITPASGFKPPLILTFQVDAAYNGHTIYILHKLSSGSVEQFTPVVADGKAVISVNELSPFLLLKDATVKITQQPQDAAVQAGGTGTFRVEAEGPAPLSYRWQLRTSAVGTWSDIEGAQSDSYTTSAVKKSNNGYQYRVAVTDGMGGSVTSDIATLTVTEAPATGDASHPVLYALMAVLLAGLALMLLKRRTA